MQIYTKQICQELVTAHTHVTHHIIGDNNALCITEIKHYKILNHFAIFAY